MNKKNGTPTGGLARNAAALGLILAAIAAVPAAAEEPSKTPDPGSSESAQRPSSGETKTETSEKATNPCAVKKKKKKGPCAVGG